MCGATVQGAPHIGHMRSAVVFDQLRRWMTYRNFDVTLVRNVTDIDDKILSKSVDEGRPWWAHAFLYEQVFTEAYDRIGVAPPTYEPRATGHIPEMIELIARLIEAGHAYPAQDGSGDVYFDTASWPEYGSLTRQDRGSMEDAADAPVRGKRDPRDFAVWKGRKDADPVTASWDTPWGRGRPGWHIECSAMSTKYLGAQFDIHGGGRDLRFPHHENEMAQSNAAGDPFANLWMHSGLVSVDGNKMSKSLGNSIFAHDLFDEYSPLLVRFFLTSGHYRSQLEFTRDNVAQQQAAVTRITNFLTRARTELGDTAPAVVSFESGYEGGHVAPEFAEAMDDDLSTPRALAVVFDYVSKGYKLLEAGGSANREELAHTLVAVETMLDTLGINPTSLQWAETASGSDSATQALDVLVSELANRRLEAKKAKDFANADAIRDQLTQAGIVIEDTADGFRYHLKD
ncbi:cysteine--tRNA ligase [Brevibacterium mcbrellneri ATCC 49030]|uniref:Cysteine--tRNA ligase n=1 Tax=Brevibacterium mcbrellneri ATCC 49030 TaxID=585530 RepID=D4YJU5_9MICO|nr:cysteine--tRNA ligase [Brevibacterium mcbrellneri ATCC 49030]